MALDFAAVQRSLHPRTPKIRIDNRAPRNTGYDDSNSCRAHDLRSCQTRTRVHCDGVACAQPSRCRRRIHQAPRAAGRRASGVRAEFDGKESPHVENGEADRVGPRYFQSVFFADPSGHRGGRPARRLLGARRRYAARREARRRLRDDAEAQRGRRPDLSRPSPASRSRDHDSPDEAAVRPHRERLRVQPDTGHAERPHRQREGGLRGDGSSLWARPSPHRHRHRPARQPAQPRSPRRRDRAGQGGKGRAPSDFRTGRFFNRVGRRRGRAAPVARRAADRHLLFQRRNGDGGHRNGEAAIGAGAARPVGRRIRRHSICAAHASAPDDDCAAGETNR